MTRGVSRGPDPALLHLAPRDATLYVGAEGGNEQALPSTIRFVAQVRDAQGDVIEGEAGALRWTSSNDSVAQVDASGQVLTISPGAIVLTVQAVTDAALLATASVTVRDAGSAVIIVR